MNKTGRTRGVVFRIIRSVASKRKLFAVTDISPPLTMQQAHCNLQALKKRGEIECIRPGRVMGDWVRRAIYRRTKSLREPNLTNKHL